MAPTHRPAAYFAVALAAVLTACLFGGCSSSTSASESELPWTERAHWEGQPGLINQPGRTGY